MIVVHIEKFQRIVTKFALCNFYYCYEGVSIQYTIKRVKSFHYNIVYYTMVTCCRKHILTILAGAGATFTNHYILRIV